MYTTFITLVGTCTCEKGCVLPTFPTEICVYPWSSYPAFSGVYYVLTNGWYGAKKYKRFGSILVRRICTLNDYGWTHNFLPKRFHRSKQAPNEVVDIQVRNRQKQGIVPWPYSKPWWPGSCSKKGSSNTKYSRSARSNLVMKLFEACGLLQKIQQKLCGDVRHTLSSHLKDHKLL